MQDWRPSEEGSIVGSRGRAVRMLVCATTMACALLVAWPAASAGAATQATFSWDRPARYLDTNADGLPDPRNTAEEVSAPFTVHVDACASTADGGSITGYQWRSAGSTPKDT